MNFKFSIITGKMIHDCIKTHHNDLYAIIKKTYQDHAQQRTINPNSYFLRFPSNPKARIIALPAAIDSEQKVSGLKWIASYPDNIKQNFPRASAVIILNDFQTGYPIACLEGSIISATRTAYSAVLAAESLHKKKQATCLGFIGNGLIARYIYSCFKRQCWDIKKIVLYDLDTQSSNNLKQFIQQDNSVEITIVHSYEALLTKADLVTLTTTVSEPYLDDYSLLKPNQTILNISLRDLSPDILIRANNVVDDIEHVLSANTSPDLTYKKYQTKDFINGTIGDYLLNPFALDKTKPTIFSPMGMGILDIALANYIYRLEKGTRCIDDFFYDLER